MLHFFSIPPRRSVRKHAALIRMPLLATLHLPPTTCAFPAQRNQIALPTTELGEERLALRAGAARVGVVLYGRDGTSEGVVKAVECVIEDEGIG